MLDALFAEARADRPRPGADLMARVMADAAAVTRPPVPRVRRASGLLRGLAAAFGGGLSLAGMVTAAAAGVWIGLAAPEPVGGLLGNATDETLDIIPDVTAMLDEAGEG
ncbi:MAG: dihydroorotate dehydrogenase [Paracoccaceae bacterium]|nr:MAG: dihydroorotate dehydrogenase [Paracoccaceae bacterium]